MSNELTTIEHGSALTVMPAMTIQEAVQRRNELVEFTKRILTENEDFGVIPGTNGKRTLLKPGAEKLTTFFGLSKKFGISEKEEDWTGERHGGEPFFFYTYKCQLWRGDLLIGESEGSCNSWESKYRWRNANRKCPKCGKETIFKSKNSDGWYCWAKKDGCGANFAGNDPAIVGQQTGRKANPDIFDQVNTIQKMAQKRALVAATLVAVGASEFFTQDAEDFDHGPVVDAEYEEKPKQQPKPDPKPNGKHAHDVRNQLLDSIAKAQDRAAVLALADSITREASRLTEEDVSVLREAYRAALKKYPEVKEKGAA